MKRIFCLFITFVMILCVFTGCNAGENESYYEGQTLIDEVEDVTADFNGGEPEQGTEDTVTAEVPQDEPETQPDETGSEGSVEVDPGEEGPVEEEPAEEEPVEEEPVSPFTHPLTGEPMDNDISEYRPFAIMLDNGIEALPQDGISYADILYEMTAYAGGATRCMGVFQDISVVDIIGGIRSCRSQFVDVALAYDAIYVHVGGSQEGLARMRSTGCTDIDDTGIGWLYRDPWRQANIGYTHSVVMDTARVLEEIEDAGYRTRHEEDYSYGLTFTAIPSMPDGVYAPKAEVNHGGNKSTFFDYNEETGLYYATQYGNPWIDRATDEQLCFTNLLFIEVTGRYSEGEYLLQTTYGEGNGYYLYGGQWIEITWSRETVNDPFEYFYLDGTPLSLAVGKTYVGIWTQYGYVNFDIEQDS